jgi:hypothetical protein
MKKKSKKNYVDVFQNRLSLALILKNVPCNDLYHSVRIADSHNVLEKTEKSTRCYTDQCVQFFEQF